MGQLCPGPNSEEEEAADARRRCMVGNDCNHHMRVVGALVCESGVSWGLVLPCSRCLRQMDICSLLCALDSPGRSHLCGRS